MDLSSINSNVLKSLIKLTEKKDNLTAEIKKIEASIGALLTGKSPVATTRKGPGKAKTKTAKAPKAPRGAKKAAPAKKGKRGALKLGILAALKAAGEGGISVKELSEKLGAKTQNIHVWFSSTGKSLPEIQKVGEARYAFAQVQQPAA